MRRSRPSRPIAEARNEPARATGLAGACRGAGATRSTRDGWDGDWYRRGYYDDGTPLGSATNEECRIDSIAQSWAAHLRRRRSGARGPGDGGARRAARASRRSAGAAVHAAVRQDARSIPATSRAIRPASARMAANTPMPPPGRSWALPRSARATRRPSCSRCSIRSITRRTRAGVLRYKVEPYVVAADVYSVPPHVGRGGWTWYTGSAGWLYRAGVEAILGLRVKGGVTGDRSVHSGRLAGLRDDAALSRRGLRDLGPTIPDGVSRGVIAARVRRRGAAVSLGKARLKLSEDQRRAHDRRDHGPGCRG